MIRDASSAQTREFTECSTFKFDFHTSFATTATGRNVTFAVSSANRTRCGRRDVRWQFQFAETLFFSSASPRRLLPCILDVVCFSKPHPSVGIVPLFVLPYHPTLRRRSRGKRSRGASCPMNKISSNDQRSVLEWLPRWLGPRSTASLGLEI